MGVTPNFGIAYPDGNVPINPIQGKFATLAGSVDDALLDIVNNIPGTLVASDSERDALYPAPVHGNAVYRTDINAIQRYYGLYSPTTNPGGASAAGWYRESGTTTSAFRNSQLDVNNQAADLDYNAPIENPAGPGDFSYGSGIFTCRRTGRYLVITNMVMEGAGANVGYDMTLHKNGAPVARVGGITSTLGDTFVQSVYALHLQVGNTVSNRVYANINPPGVGAVEGAANTFIQITRVGA